VAHRSARRLLTVLLIALASITLLPVGAIATGRAAFVGTHGVSMNPVYYQGDLVVVAKADLYKVGQIVAYHVPAKHTVALHRIIGGDPAGYSIKGDNNQSTDPAHPAAGQLIGRAILHIPHGGTWLTRFTNPAMLGLVAFGLMASGGTAIQTRRRRRKKAMSLHSTPSSRWTLPTFVLPHQLQPAAGAVAAVAAVGLALGAVAWIAPLDKPATASTQANRQVTFSYAAAVRLSPAYDGTTVHSPDPIFRRLANTVDLHFAYQGIPGTVTVAAELSTPSGWHSSVPLAQPASFAGNRYESTVRLNPKAFEARAQSAAAVTGLPAEPLTITVVPSVQTEGNVPFAPALKLNLTPLQLSLAGDPKSLIVEESTAVSHLARSPRMLNLLIGHVTVGHARAASAVLILAAMLAAATLAFVIRNTPPLSEGAGIRRRYGPLLASVDPMITPPHIGIIEVAEFATLAKMAERGGLLVVNWSRSDVDTFMVLDESTAYRYRTGSNVGKAAGMEAPAPL
jgi:signal peptidase I